MQELGLADVLKGMLHQEPGMASAMGRSLTEHETHVLLDLLDLGWAVRTPISFLDRGQQARLRELLLAHADDPSFDRGLVDALKKPPVDQVKLFEQFAIPAKERQQVTQIARVLLLDNPALHKNAPRLEGQVAQELAKLYPAPDAPLPERVAARFLRSAAK
jgi:hypothetical protein